MNKLCKDQFIESMRIAYNIVPKNVLYVSMFSYFQRDTNGATNIMYWRPGVRSMDFNTNLVPNNLSATFFYGEINFRWFPYLAPTLTNVQFYFLLDAIGNIQPEFDSYSKLSSYLFRYDTGGTLGDPFPIATGNRFNVKQWPEQNYKANVICTGGDITVQATVGSLGVYFELWQEGFVFSVR